MARKASAVATLKLKPSGKLVTSSSTYLSKDFRVLSASSAVEFQLAFQCRKTTSASAVQEEDISKNPGLIAHTTAPAGSSAVIALGAPQPLPPSAQQPPVD